MGWESHRTNFRTHLIGLIAYLTLGDKCSGIFSGQVVDVCNLLSEQSGEKVKLISFVSLREYRKEKIKIKDVYQNSIVLPMFPKLKNWRYNIILLFLFTRSKKYNTIICRNSIPANLGLILKKKSMVKRVILDGRGAEYEQYVEYDMLSDKELEKKLRQLESIAVNDVDFRIAVSEKLVNYWNYAFNYLGKEHIVIPCTLNRNHEKRPLNMFSRASVGFENNDIILVYCGTVSGWQSFGKMFRFMKSQLIQNQHIKVLLLTKETDEVKSLIKEFPDRVICKWCSDNDVIPMMSLGDYGLVIRGNTITNEVASPVKFAEYLYAGLKVIISEKIGDYNLFVKENKCGIVDTEIKESLNKLDEQDKSIERKLAKENFSKNENIIKSKYETLLKKCN